MHNYKKRIMQRIIPKIQNPNSALQPFSLFNLIVLVLQPIDLALVSHQQAAVLTKKLRPTPNDEKVCDKMKLQITEY